MTPVPDAQSPANPLPWRAVQVHKAEAIILGCTLEIGFYRELQDYLNGPEAFPGAGIPVIDPSIAAFKAARKMRRY